ncbi:multicopper oxidase domain-containing protein [Pseudomonas sp. UL073]|uniref:Multicopper oxidase CueO n=1 Tax=Zestomonas insulae TaxID=2809017 RepID=A0ABS2IGU4_9GAMM|nr:multicopper oxidase domain-containing protein [Pseudomonas insulae]MBM7062292.1 multicopper oxidase domain-containing protein [Pseudomonas insulae]
MKNLGNQREPPPSRRAFLRYSAAALASPWLLRGLPVQAASGPGKVAPSPPTTPWLDELPPLRRLLPLNLDDFDPAPTLDANNHGGRGPEAGRNRHQRYEAITAQFGISYYEMHARQGLWQFHSEYPPQPIWGYCTRDARRGLIEPPSIPGPLFIARYGKPAMCRIYNDLPATASDGIGTPEISTHLHNLHSPSESDGFPGDYYSAGKSGPTLGGPGSFKDHFYPNLYAGYGQYPPLGDPREALGTLWYHDHCLDFTAPNTYKGLFGLYLLYDDLDSGDESTGLRLPSGDYDYPLTFIDRRFDASGRLVFDQFNPEGTLGDKVVVNGKIEPYLRVKARKYRFRLLDAGPPRFYSFVIADAGGRQLLPFDLIANDGNLLPKPLRQQTSVSIATAERADIVVDFKGFEGRELYLFNRLRQTSTRLPDDLEIPGTPVLKFIVGASAPDFSQVPDTLRELPPISAAELKRAKVRRWVFARKGGMWTINDQLVDVTQPRAIIPQGSGEIWELVNPGGGWQHPIHIHFEEGQILEKRLGNKVVPIPPRQQGRKDVYLLEENTTLRLFMRFRDFDGKYVMHCHNMIHEDHAMMLRWDIQKV